MLLQLLSDSHAPIVELLGKNSGRDTDKIGRVSELLGEEMQLLNG
jgi:hypothetical protein